MENKQNIETNIFGYPFDSSSCIETPFEQIMDYGDVTNGFLSKDTYTLVSDFLQNESKTLKYRLLLNVFFVKEDYDDKDEIGKPYAELVIVPEYRNLNRKNRKIAMEIVDNNVLEIKKNTIYGKLWATGVGVCLLQQYDGFMEFKNEQDFREKFYLGFRNIYKNIIEDMDLYLDRNRGKGIESYWDEISSYCS